MGYTRMDSSEGGNSAYGARGERRVRPMRMLHVRTYPAAISRFNLAVPPLLNLARYSPFKIAIDPTTILATAGGQQYAVCWSFEMHAI